MRRLWSDRRIAWALVVVWTCIIFSFSLQPQEDSSRQSSRVQERLQPVVESIEKSLGVELIPADDFHRFTRKSAHFGLFMVLGALALRAGRISGWSGRKAGLFALFWVVAAACADETLQTFVPGRGGQLGDVIIDTAGGLVGMGLVVIAGKMAGRPGKI